MSWGPYCLVELFASQFLFYNNKKKIKNDKIKDDKPE